MAKPDNLKKMNVFYNIIKQCVEFIFPALGALYFGLAATWGLPYGEKIIGTLSVLTVFLGGLLKYKRVQYYSDEQNFDGQMVVTEKPTGGKKYSLELGGDPADMVNKKTVEFKVVPSATAEATTPQ